MNGYIRKRPNGAWEVSVDLGFDPATGKRLRISRSVRGTLDDAETLRAELVVGARRGTVTTTGATFGELLEEWYRLASPEWSPSTARETASICNRLRPRLGPVRLRRLRTVDLDRFYAELRGEGLSPGRIRRIHVVIRGALRQGVTWGWIADNPANNARLPKATKTKVRAPAPADVARLAAAAAEADPELGLFLRLLAVMGARRGEVCGLRWSDVTGPVVHVERVVVDAGPGKGLVVKDRTKNDDDRFVTVDAGTVELLASHRTRMAERALYFGIALPADAYVFSSEPDCLKPWRPDGVTHRFVRIRNHLGLEGVRLHDLRHHVATQLRDAGMPLASVASRLGHRRQSTTADMYDHPIDARDPEAAEIMGRLLGS